MSEVRITETGAEIHIRVNGEWTWRPCFVTYDHGERVISPEMRDGEHLLRTLDGQCQIVMGMPSAPRVITRVLSDGISTKDGCA